MAQSHFLIFVKYFKEVFSSRRQYSAMSQTSNHLLTTSHLVDRNVNMITELADEAEDLSKSLQLLFWFREEREPLNWYSLKEVIFKS